MNCPVSACWCQFSQMKRVFKCCLNLALQIYYLQKHNWFYIDLVGVCVSVCMCHGKLWDTYCHINSCKFGFQMLWQVFVLSAVQQSSKWRLSSAISVVCPFSSCLTTKTFRGRRCLPKPVYYFTVLRKVIQICTKLSSVFLWKHSHQASLNLAR